jgi:hypothetical protein
LQCITGAALAASDILQVVKTVVTIIVFDFTAAAFFKFTKLGLAENFSAGAVCLKIFFVFGSANVLADTVFPNFIHFLALFFTADLRLRLTRGLLAATAPLVKIVPARAWGAPIA